MVCLSVAPSFWKWELTSAGCAPHLCPCLPTGRLELPCSQLLPLHSLPQQRTQGFLHSSFVVTQGNFQIHISAAACTIMYALTSHEHFKLSMEYSKSGLFCIPQVNRACIFQKKYLKNFGTWIGDHPRSFTGLQNLFYF